MHDVTLGEDKSRTRTNPHIFAKLEYQSTCRQIEADYAILKDLLEEED